MFANHQITANIKWNFSDTTFDAALTKPRAVNITMTINRGNHNGIGTRFYRCVNIFILTHHYAKVDDIKVMRGENSIQNFIANSMAVSANDANNERWFFMANPLYRRENIK